MSEHGLGTEKKRKPLLGGSHSMYEDIREYDTYMSTLFFVVPENDRKRGFYGACFLHFTPWREE